MLTRDVMAGLIAAIHALPAYGKKNVDARDKRGHGDGEVLRPHRNALKSPQPAGAETKRFEPVRRHIRHKHLPERDYALEKIFPSRNGR